MLAYHFKEWCAYLSSLGRSPKTVNIRSRSVEQFIEWGGFTAPNQITESRISDYHSFLGRKYQSMGTIAVKSYSVRLFMRYLFDRDLTLINIDEVVEPIKATKYREVKDVFSEDEIRELMKGLRKPKISKRTRAIIELLYATGIRRNEATKLDVFDLDLYQRVLMVRQGKGNKDRLLPVGKDAIEAVKDYLKNYRERYVKPETKALFINRDGERINVNDMQSMFWRVNQRIKLKRHVTPHALRHAVATHLLRAGLDITYVSRFLGHSSVESTRIYTHLVSADLKHAIDEQHPRNRMRK